MGKNEKCSVASSAGQSVKQSQATSIEYVGGELELFGDAANWKRYLRDSLSRFVEGDVADVGAGLGATVAAFAGSTAIRSWTSIEPDPRLLEHLARRIAAAPVGFPVEACAGTLRDLPKERSFDTIVYIDVLEHIADDKAEISEAADRLRSGGRLVVLCPAYQFMYSSFDGAVGHYRRYSKTSLRQTAESPLVEEAAFYLDSAGFVASLANKILLHQRLPSKRQITFWDVVLIPVSRILDRVLRRAFGKSVVLVWTKPRLC